MKILCIQEGKKKKVCIFYDTFVLLLLGVCKFIHKKTSGHIICMYYYTFTIEVKLCNFIVFIFLLCLQHFIDSLIPHPHASSLGQGLKIPSKTFCENRSFYIIGIN